ncbi:MAG: hypothetical protein ACI8X5_000364, partial [Planctomycetota bacterium]
MVNGYWRTFGVGGGGFGGGNWDGRGRAARWGHRWTAPLAPQTYAYGFGGFWPGGVSYGLIALGWLQLKSKRDLETTGASQRTSTGGSGVCGGFEL